MGEVAQQLGRARGATLCAQAGKGLLRRPRFPFGGFAAAEMCQRVREVQSAGRRFVGSAALLVEVGTLFEAGGRGAIILPCSRDYTVGGSRRGGKWGRSQQLRGPFQLGQEISRGCDVAQRSLCSYCELERPGADGRLRFAHVSEE